MSSRMQVYQCPKCGKIILQQGKDIGSYTCHEPMVLLPIQTEGIHEDDHLPVISRKDGVLYAYCGTENHPMEEDHFISFMVLESENGYRVVYFQPHEEAKVQFYPGEPITAVYVYCTKHGLWMMES